MNVNKVTNNLYNSKLLQKGLEFAADNGALFAAGTSLALSMAVRPLSILATPKADKENKKTACAKSIASSLTGYFIMLGFSRPVSKAIKQINKKPQEFLSPKTIENLKDGAKELTQSKTYILATQLFKLGLGMVIAAPKAILTSTVLPMFMPKKEKGNDNKLNQNPSFTGLSKGISKILNSDSLQEFAKKHKDSNFPMHIMALTDTITTATFIEQTKRSKKIEENKKPMLIYNSAISTGLSIVSGYTIDKLLDKPTEKFIEKLKEANKNSPKLDKYVEGVKIAKPILILGGIYYIIIPIISTFIADRMEKNEKRS